MWSTLFPKNQGALDRGVRVFVGGLLVFMALIGTTAWGWVGLLPLLTGLAGSCPVYRIFGISTCPARDERSATFRSHLAGTRPARPR